MSRYVYAVYSGFLNAIGAESQAGKVQRAEMVAEFLQTGIALPRPHLQLIYKYASQSEKCISIREK